MMALRMRQLRPTLTCEKRILFSISEKELTRTSGDRTQFCTEPPEIMQPDETRESSAWPMRPASENTNFAGGYWRWWVRIGQASSYRLNTGETETRSMFAS